MDEVLSVAHTYIVDNGLSVISIPNIEASFSQEVSLSYTKYAKYLYLRWKILLSHHYVPRVSVPDPIYHVVGKVRYKWRSSRSVGLRRKNRRRQFGLRHKHWRPQSVRQCGTVATLCTSYISLTYRCIWKVRLLVSPYLYVHGGSTCIHDTEIS